jgi:hypothetical protein
MRKALLIGLALLMMTPTLEAQWRRGGFGGGPRMAYRGWYGGMGFYPWYPMGWGGPWGWGGPMIGVGTGFGSDDGKLKVETPLKDAEVLIDGAFVGTVGELKALRLKPGAYNVEVRALGRSKYAERVYIVAGRTLKLRPELRVP